MPTMWDLVHDVRRLVKSTQGENGDIFNKSTFMWCKYKMIIEWKCHKPQIMQPFTIMCKQTETMHVDKQLKPEQLKEPIAMYDCDQHLNNSQL